MRLDLIRFRFYKSPKTTPNLTRSAHDAFFVIEYMYLFKKLPSDNLYNFKISVIPE